MLSYRANGVVFAFACLACAGAARADKTLEERIADLETKNLQLEKLVQAQSSKLVLEDQKLTQSIDRLKEKDAERSRLRFDGYVDFGFFAPSGNGVGFVRDVNNTQRANFPNTPWILLGDPWSTAVNSRGEPASTVGSFAIPFDNIQSGGHDTFILNEIQLNIEARIAPNASMHATVNFLPREGSGGTLGDFFEAPYGYLEWRPWKDRDATVEIGKYRSVFGLEYRQQESPDRTGITPSLIYRYVAGHPLGLKLRQRWPDGEHENTILNLSLQNSSSNLEEFDFGEEISGNDGKTVSGRISHGWKAVKWADAAEIGFSAEYGTEAKQPRDSIHAYQFDLDAQYEKRRFTVNAEAIRVVDEGAGLGVVPSLDSRGFYIIPSYRLTTQTTTYVRWEFRRATHIGETFAYVMDTERWTAGVRYDFNPHWILKVEYLRNIERGADPTIDNDIFTVSQVLTF